MGLGGKGLKLLIFLATLDPGRFGVILRFPSGGFLLVPPGRAGAGHLVALLPFGLGGDPSCALYGQAEARDEQGQRDDRCPGTIERDGRLLWVGHVFLVSMREPINEHRVKGGTDASAREACRRPEIGLEPGWTASSFQGHDTNIRMKVGAPRVLVVWLRSASTALRPAVFPSSIQPVRLRCSRSATLTPCWTGGRLSGRGGLGERG